MKMEVTPEELASFFVKCIEARVTLELGKLRLELESYTASRIDAELSEFSRKLQQKAGPI